MNKKFYVTYIWTANHFGWWCSKPVCFSYKSVCVDAQRVKQAELGKKNGNMVILWPWRTVVIQSPSPVQLFVTPWTRMSQASLFFTISWSLLKFMSTELVKLFNHLTLCFPLSPFAFNLPSIRVFSMSWLFTSGGKIIEASASISVPPMNIQEWFSFRIDCLLSLQSKGLSRVFSNTTVQKHQFFGAQLSSQTH